ncbi:hypothetical protein ACJMK2_002592 [Sinanodonta woodiana]|uniref:Uncharacterized protein n=1 Tax=Sinanodonta woodiana TaxID=1069815 RepID=A0ABD3XWD9_SINWO
MNLQKEFYNMIYKDSVKDAGSHLTSATIARHSQMVGVGKILRSVYDKQVSDLSGRTVHMSFVSKTNSKGFQIKAGETQTTFVKAKGNNTTNAKELIGRNHYDCTFAKQSGTECMVHLHDAFGAFDFLYEKYNIVCIINVLHNTYWYLYGN